MIKAYFKAGLVVWVARLSALTLLFIAPWAGLGKFLLLLSFFVLDVALCSRVKQMARAGNMLTGWRASNHDGFLPSATELAQVKPTFETPTRFENEAVAVLNRP